mgnify:CR=1 FL=1
MMSTILTLIILGMVFQGVMAVVNSVLDTVGVNSMLGSIPVVGSNLNLIWAYLFVAISDLGGWGYAASTDILGMGEFGTDLGSAIAICAFIPVKDAALSALSKGVARWVSCRPRAPLPPGGGAFAVFRVQEYVEHLFVTR